MDGINVAPNARIVRRWAAKFAPMTIAQFAMITEADASGRDKGRFQPGAAFEAIAIQENCGAQAPIKIIQGRHCIAAGIKPGPQIGQIVEACFQAQMDGVFSDEQGGIAFMKSVINNG
jgi:tRNA nucleotidyltransferase (CCA-adding enzyme)